MSPKNWMIQVFLLGFLCPVDLSYFFPLFHENLFHENLPVTGHQEKIRKCWGKQTYVVADNFYGIITAEKHFKAKLEALGVIPQKDPIVVCEGETDELRCGDGEVIYVRRAMYGRRDKTTCSSGRSASELEKTQCASTNSSGIVARSCNGKPECKIEANNRLFGEPCQGTYKYLEVDYTCLALGVIPQKDPIVVCEEKTAKLECGDGEVIYVRRATCGRRDKTTCSSGKPDIQLEDTQFIRTDKVAQSCNGKQECEIKAENGGNDPCPGIHKYLEVNYTCLDANGRFLELFCADNQDIEEKLNKTVDGRIILKKILSKLPTQDENQSEPDGSGQTDSAGIPSDIRKDIEKLIKQIENYLGKWDPALGLLENPENFKKQIESYLDNVVAVEIEIESIQKLCQHLQSDGNSDFKNLTERIINTAIFDTEGKQCLIFLQKNETRQEIFWNEWPQVKENDDLLLYIPKRHVWSYVSMHPMHVFGGKHCLNSSESCKSGTSVPKTCSDSPKFQEKECRDQVYNDRYIMNLTASPPLCINCDNPVKAADEKIQMNTTIVAEGEEIEATKAVQLMSEMGNLISKMNGTSAELSVGKGVEGIIVRQTNPQELDEVSFAYQDPNDKLKIIEDREYLEGFSRSVSIPREAFEKAFSSNITLPFAAVLRFMNLSQDESNSSVLNNEVVAIEMGTEIKNLTDTISINFNILNESKFRNLKKEYEPICRSWNGEGSKPNWTVEGCTTILDNDGVRCRCSHLTFFAVLLTPLNQTISSHDLNILTMITQVGCGFSIFFLGIILFMYFLIRKTQASTATQILIHLICALLLLNLTFLVNHFVADMNSEVGCEVMAAVMHYCMLATFSWFAAQGFHLCLQLHKGGNITIRRYVLKVSVFTWTLPGILVIILGSLRKYGKQTIYTDDPENNVAMCWITDNNIHYVVNIGYYSLVFLFTITTVIIILSWLCCLKKTKAASPKENRSGSRIVIIMGLCFQLGVTWGFAFFAYGDFRMIATYIFTVLNSFQGFFLFIYYYKTSRVSPNATDEKGNSNSSSVSTLKSGLENIVNPYVSFEKEKAK